MKKILRTAYFIGISLILFGCLLDIGKGFDLTKIIKTTPGTLFLLLMFISTFIVMFLSGEKKITLNEVNQEKIKFSSFDIERALFEKFLSEQINSEDENLKISYELIEKTITTTISVNNIQNVEVSKVVAGLKEKIEKSLQEKFEIKDEFEFKFNVIENKEKG
jgi:hypothetical protein